MNWASPNYLWLLWLTPLVPAALWYTDRRRAAALSRFMQPIMAKALAPMPSVSPLWLRVPFVTLAMITLVVALARPQYGVYFEDVSAQGADVFVLIDASRSMLAEDVSPNRLARAKSDVMDLLEKIPSDRVGLIAFAGAPAVMVPLTLDHGFFKVVLQELSNDSAPRGGTNIGDAIRKAIEQFDKAANRDRAIVLITDGGDQESFPIEAANLAAERNVRIITVGLGDPTEGARIPKRDKEGGLSYQQFQGQEVWSKMDDTVLKEIARVSSGAYIPAQTRLYDLGQIYSENLNQLRRGEMFTEKRKRAHEQYQYPVGIGVILLLLERVMSRLTARTNRKAQS
ncbi:MAG: VWA domain-containing protein [Pirellulales bacterium]